MATKTVEFKPIELKDYGYESGLNDELISKDSILNDFRFTDMLDFDQQFEGVAPTSFLPGSFNSVIDLTKGFEIKTDKSKQISYFQTKDFDLNQEGWQMDSLGNITARKIRTAPGGKRIELNSLTNEINFYDVNGDEVGDIQGGSALTLGITAATVLAFAASGVAVMASAGASVSFGVPPVAGSSGITLGNSTTPWLQTHTQDLRLYDGITAPTAQANRAILFVDAADGDLKVRFADGFTATIALDS